MTTPEYFGVRELLGLPASECLGECSRCGGSTFPLLQLRVISHQVALCRSCLDELTDLVAHGLPKPEQAAMTDFRDYPPGGSLPVAPPPGQVLVHNHVEPARHQGVRGFRFWFQSPNDHLERCACRWAPEIPEHYLVLMQP